MSDYLSFDLLADCAAVDIAAMPGGGTVVVAQRPAQVILLWLSAAGELVGTKSYDMALPALPHESELDPSLIDLAVDDRGLAVLAVTVPTGPCATTGYMGRLCAHIELIGTDTAQTTVFRTTATGGSGRLGESLELDQHFQIPHKGIDIGNGSVALATWQEAYYCGGGCYGDNARQAVVLLSGLPVSRPSWEHPAQGGAPTAPDAFTYVALGDSYSAGEGVEPFFDLTNRCHRSTLAYATKVEEPGSPGRSVYVRMLSGDPGVAWGFQACSGAETKDLLTEGHHGDPLPQLELDRRGDVNNSQDLPVDARTDLVTLTVGGNDVQFAAILEFCGTTRNCTGAMFGSETLSAYVDRQLAELGSKLDAVYAKIAERAGSARLLVLGYPQLFPASAKEQKCKGLRETNVRGFTLGFTVTEQEFLRNATTRLNNLIKERVEASGTGEFIRTDVLFAGHEVCGSLGEWLNGVSKTVGKGTGGVEGYIDDESFHPNSCGQDAFAVLVNLRLNAYLRDVVC